MKNLDVMISINPPYSDMIMRKYKMIEFRKKIMKNIKFNTTYIYETKRKGGIGKVIGECKIVDIFELDNSNEREEMIEDIYKHYSLNVFGEILYNWEFDSYFINEFLEEIGYSDDDSEDGYNAKYGLRLCNIKKYDKPLELSQFLNSKNEVMKRPPQNMCYCKRIER